MFLKTVYCGTFSTVVIFKRLLNPPGEFFTLQIATFYKKSHAGYEKAPLKWGNRGFFSVRHPFPVVWAGWGNCEVRWCGQCGPARGSAGSVCPSRLSSECCPGDESRCCQPTRGMEYTRAWLICYTVLREDPDRGRAKNKRLSFGLHLFIVHGWNVKDQPLPWPQAKKRHTSV